MPGGVNSPVRAYQAVGGVPPVIARGAGARLWDVEGREYIDYVGSWGPAILGHAHSKVVGAVQEVAARGLSFGAPTELENRLARMVCDAVPSVEKIRFVNSGTEATMSAIRLARGATGRDKIVKFEGCYHGHADSLLVKAGSGAATHGCASSAGVPADFAKHSLVARYNNLDSVEKLFAAYGGEIACLLVEPVAGNMGCVPPRNGFLKGLRDLCSASGVLLIFDEVMTGFRVALGGAQELYGVTPDLTCLGKIIGGGLPVGAYGGRRELMDQISPLGPVYQAGTLSGNPLAMTAGIKTLEMLVQYRVYDRLEEISHTLLTGLTRLLEKSGFPFQLQSVGSMWTLFFNEAPVVDFETALVGDAERFKKYFHAALKNGLYLPASPFESNFISLAHEKRDIDETLSRFDAIFNEINL